MRTSEFYVLNVFVKECLQKLCFSTGMLLVWVKDPYLLRGSHPRLSWSGKTFLFISYWGTGGAKLCIFIISVEKSSVSSQISCGFNFEIWVGWISAGILLDIAQHNMTLRRWLVFNGFIWSALLTDHDDAYLDILFHLNTTVKCKV